MARTKVRQHGSIKKSTVFSGNVKILVEEETEARRKRILVPVAGVSLVLLL